MAVKSGWWLFGTELVTPLIVAVTIYIEMYTIFALLSVNYYKKVIKESLKIEGTVNFKLIGGFLR